MRTSSETWGAQRLGQYTWKPCLRHLAFCCLVSLTITCSFAKNTGASSSSSNSRNIPIDILGRRGGTSGRRKSLQEDGDPFVQVARAIRHRMASDDNEEVDNGGYSSSDPPGISEITDALHILSSSQQTFKGLDGAAHEAYQMTHAGATEVDVSVSGRARRSAARAAATADGLGACELCELLEIPFVTESSTLNGTLAGRHVVLNITASDSPILLDGTKVPVVVLYEPVYTGGAGILHGGIADVSQTAPRRGPAPKGRLLVIVGDKLQKDLAGSLKVLDKAPMHVRLSSGLVTNEVASVQPSLYKAAGSLLKSIEPTLREYENRTSAIHFVGRSLGGGVANLAAIMLDGDLPTPRDKNRKSRKQKSRRTMSFRDDQLLEATNNGIASDSLANSAEASTNVTVVPLPGLGKDRTSSVSLGAPPCVSSNVQSGFVTSIMYGDDVICRTSRDSLDRLLKRSKKALKSKGWIGGKQLNFMSDALSITMTSLRTHAHGSEGEELRLSVPGRAYLLRPRRLGGLCSIHEVGNRLKGGREALRAHVLWQLDDILLSKSLWKHHQLGSYIHGLDRAHLRSFTEEEDDSS